MPDLGQPPAADSVISLPGSAQELTREWLSAALSQEGPDVEVTDFHERPMPAHRGYTSQVLRFEVEYANDFAEGPSRLVVKLPPGVASERELYSSRGVDLKEVDFYRTYASECPVRVPRCYFADIEPVETLPAARKSILLLEDLGGAAELPPLVSCSEDRARLVVESAARLHAAFACDSRLPERGGSTGGIEEQYTAAGNLFEALWPFFREYAGDAMKPSIDQRVHAIAEFIRAVPARIRSSGGTLVHGDYWNGNFLFESSRGEGERLALIDWGESGWGFEGMDLAIFLGASLEREIRRQREASLLELYWREAERAGRASASKLWIEEEYRAGLLVWLTMPVLESGGRVALEGADAAGDLPDKTAEYAALERANTERLLAAVVDSDALDLL